MALVLILIVAGSVSPNFFEIRIVEGRLFGNLIDILYRAVPTALVALGMAVVIGTRGIDLSVDLDKSNGLTTGLFAAQMEGRDVDFVTPA